MKNGMIEKGDIFERLTAISDPYKKTGNRRYFVDFLCSCGTTKTIMEYAVKSGGTKSCGCLRRDNTINLKLSHGMYT